MSSIPEPPSQNLDATLALVAKLQAFGLLDQAYALAQPTYFAWLEKARCEGQDLAHWAAGIGTLARTAYLADTSDIALRWLDCANSTLDAIQPANETARFTLMGEIACLLVETEDRNQQFAGYISLLRLLDYDFTRFINLKKQRSYEAMNLSDIALRLCDLCLINAVCRFELPSELADCADLLYREVAIEQPWGLLPAGSTEAACIGLATRHLASAVTYLKRNTFPLDTYTRIELPFFELNVAFLDFVSASESEFVSSAARRFLQAVRMWRGMIRSLKSRNALRSRINFIAGPFLQRLRRQGVQDWQLLSDAEEVLGPSRWLEEELAEISSPEEKVPVVLRPEVGPPKELFPESGAIVQVLPMDNDLIVVCRGVDSAQGGIETWHGKKIPSGALHLRQVYARYFGEHGIVNGICRRLSGLQRNELAELIRLRQELHHATVKAANEVGRVVLPCIYNEVQDRDVLLVSPDPRILCLPWSLAQNDDVILIKHVRSITVSASIGASIRLAEISKERQNNQLFQVAAYCDCSQGLNWRRLFSLDGTAFGLGKLALQNGIGLQMHGISDGDFVSVQDLMDYPTKEADVLLVCGHGDRRRGVRLGMEHWNPLHAARGWRLQRTQCAIVPSCRLGELLWDSSSESLADRFDPGKHEVTGFMAHLCLGGIPRVIACPWVAFDVTVSRLIGRIVERATVLQSSEASHVWARSLRDVIVEDLSDSGENRPYDLANLILFGAP
jgi:hypothetical protein